MVAETDCKNYIFLKKQMTMDNIATLTIMLMLLIKLLNILKVKT